MEKYTESPDNKFENREFFRRNSLAKKGLLVLAAFAAMGSAKAQTETLDPGAEVGDQTNKESVMGNPEVLRAYRDSLYERIQTEQLNIIEKEQWLSLTEEEYVELQVEEARKDEQRHHEAVVENDRLRGEAYKNLEFNSEEREEMEIFSFAVTNGREYYWMDPGNYKMDFLYDAVYYGVVPSFEGKTDEERVEMVAQAIASRDTILEMYNQSVEEGIAEWPNKLELMLEEVRQTAANDYNPEAWQRSVDESRSVISEAKQAIRPNVIQQGLRQGFDSLLDKFFAPDYRDELISGGMSAAEADSALFARLMVALQDAETGSLATTDGEIDLPGYLSGQVTRVYETSVEAPEFGSVEYWVKNPEQLDDRKQSFQEDLAFLGIWQYGREFTARHYQQAKDNLNELRPSSKEFLELIKEQKMPHVMNKIDSFQLEGFNATQMGFFVNSNSGN